MQVNISPINGHEIKHREAEKLNQDVEKFLKERELTVLPVAFKPKKLRTECKPYRAETGWTYKPKPKKNSGYTQRLIEQSNLLARYVELSPKYRRWKKVIEATSRCISGHTLSQVAMGQCFIADDRVWQVVKEKVTEMINNIESKVA